MTEKGYRAFIKTLLSHWSSATHINMYHNYRKSAFTLAEVLITLGIIGVVAALTIPIIVAEYQKIVTVNLLKQTYAQINTAIELIAIKDYAGQGMGAWQDCGPGGAWPCLYKVFDQM